MQPIYLDNAATTPILPEVAEKVRQVSLVAANPASMHREGQRARQWLEDAREAIADGLGADLGAAGGDRLVFTSGGTEANNLALLGLAGKDPAHLEHPAHLITSRLEHPSVAKAVDELERRGWLVDRLAPDSGGVISPELLATSLRDDTRLVSITYTSHETGVVQPIGELAAVCNSRGVPLHSDAMQAVGKMPIDFSALGLAALSLSGHKFHGPTGIGGLLLRRDAEPLSQAFGGNQEASLRPGTQPTALAVGMQVALGACLTEIESHSVHVQALREQFEARILAEIPAAVVHGRKATRSPYLSNISLVGCHRERLLMALDLAEVACSTGSACESGSTEPSPTLKAMGCPGEQLDSALRFSFSHQNTTAEIDAAAGRIVAVYHDLESQNSG
jgi:cysteine desulfurase